MQRTSRSRSCVTITLDVIYSLNNKIEVQDLALHAIKEHYENSLKKCLYDASSQQQKADDTHRLASHVQMLEMQLAVEREKHRRLQQPQQQPQQQQSSLFEQTTTTPIATPPVTRDLAMLFQELRDKETEFEKKLSEFEHLHNEMAAFSSCVTAVPTSDRSNNVDSACCSTAVDSSAIQQGSYEKHHVLLTTTTDFELSEDAMAAACLKRKRNETANNPSALVKSGPCSVSKLIAQFSTRNEDPKEVSDTSANVAASLSPSPSSGVKLKAISIDRNNFPKGGHFSRGEELIKAREDMTVSQAPRNQVTSLSTPELSGINENSPSLNDDKISMLEATKTEQEIVINKLQTEVVKLKEKVRHLCKLRQDLLEQRSQVEDRVRSVQRERDHDISTRDSRIRELEDELEQYECKMEYLEHTQVHLQRSLLASENKTPKLLEELQKISADLADCKSDLKEKNQRIHELANSVMTKEAMIERLQNDLKAFKKEAAQEMEKRFLLYTEEKERLMSQLQEETEEYVKAAFAEKDCQLRELNEDWQNKYDQLNEKLSSLRKELEDAIAEKNDLLMSRDAGSSDDEDEDDDGSGEDSTDSTSSASELDWQVQERVERFREELTRIHSINTIEQRTAHEKQLGEVRDKLEQKITLLKKQHEEELREFDQLLNDELNRVHKKYQAELRRLREQVSSSPDCGTGVIKTDKGVQAFIGRSFSSSASSANAQEYLEDSEKLAEFKLQLSEVQDQLRQKQDEVIKVRTEASNQIRNVELYWQERLNKEIKELNMARENELADIRHECNKQVKQLTDKINSLQTIMKLTGQDQPLVTPIVEEPSSGEEDLEATDEDVESFEEVDGDADDTEDDEANGDGDEEGEVEIEEIIEEIIELSPCAQRVTALRHNPLILSPSSSLEGGGGSGQVVFPRSLLKKSSSTGDCPSDVRGPRGSKRVSFAEDRGDLPMLLRYNPDVSCMDILRPLEEQFISKKKRSSIIRRSVRRSQEKADGMDHDQTQF
ncbi:putative leucine-rich repeat-containing protein DDB_G0290503 isoform X3 [Varroa jacobsoni]|uniref:putative leucine-rich repeat-containing protein DDB_G0290503 isoform X3 n=1 Tax=Varroa jacobsoni TaxID=62625 RepID=UPI000BF7475D|nr:putative leucine-rich repeat-containing protein DDB_G0290503 isoform X3 [Varroa jacobsoni]